MSFVLRQSAEVSRGADGCRIPEAMGWWFLVSAGAGCGWSVFRRLPAFAIQTAMRKHYVLIPSIAVLHLVASVVLLLTSAGASVDELETGPSYTLLEHISSAAGTVLFYPVFIPLSEVFGMNSGGIAWMLLIINSLLWAAVITYLLHIATAHWRREPARPPLKKR